MRILVYTHTMYLRKDAGFGSYLYDSLLARLASSEIEYIWHLRERSLLGEIRGYSAVKLSSCFQQIAVLVDRYIATIFKRIFHRRLRPLVYFSVERLYWLAYLKSLDIRLIVGLEPSIELCKAARYLGVLSVDLEHGRRTPLSYYLRDSYRYDKAGYPDAMVFSNNMSALSIREAVPSYVEFLGEYDIEYVSQVESHAGSENTLGQSYLLFIDQYLMRGSSESHPILPELLGKELDIDVKVRVHPKFNNKNDINRKKQYYRELFSLAGLDGKLSFSEGALIYDMVASRGVIAHSSSCIDKAVKLKVPVFIYGNDPVYNDSCEKDWVFSRKNERGEDEWQLFLDYCEHHQNRAIACMDHSERLSHLVDILLERLKKPVGQKIDLSSSSRHS